MKTKRSWFHYVWIFILLAPQLTHASIGGGNADLALGKSATAATVQLGQPFSFTLSLTNLGPDHATNVLVLDELPPGLNYLSSSGDGYDPLSGYWLLPEALAGTVSFLTITVQATGSGAITNFAAIVASSVNDTNAANDTASAGVNVVSNPSADLRILKTASATNVSFGQQVVFTLTLENLGPNPITNEIVTTDCLPAGFQYVTDSTYGGGTNGVYSPGTCWWTLPDGLGTNFPAVLQITTLAVSAGTYTNSASVAVPAGVTDPNLTNNVASVIVSITPAVTDLQVTKTVDINTLPVNSVAPFNFFLTVTNLGPQTVSNLTVSDLLPAGLVFSSSINGPDSSYEPSNGVWSILVPLNAGQGSKMTLAARGTNFGTFTNSASVNLPVGFVDPNTNNNSASVAVVVPPILADLAITKIVLDTNTLPINSLNPPFNFRITITNRGPDTVPAFTVTDLLPPGLSYDSSVEPGDSPYQPTNGLWSVVSLQAGQGRAFTLAAQGTNAGTFTNLATINIPPGVNDTNARNNSAQAVVTVLPVYRISGFVFNCSSNGMPLGNVKVTLSGAANRVTTTTLTGAYSFGFLSNGNYTITPTQPGNTFVPPSLNVTVSNANVAAPALVGSVGLIYGRLDYFGSPITNHLVKLTGAQTRTVLTDANGFYIFTNTPPGNFTVTPVVTNAFVFTPTNAAVGLNASNNCAGLALFSAQHRRGVQLVALEVVQVIQDWSNSVRLIEAKETYVRAHLQLTNNNPVLLQGARLHGTGTGGALAGSPLSPIPPGTLWVRTTNAAAGRTLLTNSLNFRLPDAWLSGAVSLRFECTNNVTVVPTNVVPASSTVAVSFTASRPLPILIFPVNWQRTADATLQQNTTNNLNDLPRRLLSMFPVPRVDSTLLPPIVAPFTAQPVQADYNALNAQLAGFRQLALFFITDNRLYHGAVARGGPAMVATGEAHLPGFISSALMPNNADFYVDNWLRHLATHEIGHNLGRQHDVDQNLFGVAGGGAKGPCGEIGALAYVYPLFQPVPAPAGPTSPALGPMTNGVNSLVFGLDTLTLRTAPQHNPVADPNADFDVMGYCRHAPLQWWISSFTYPAMYGYITNTFVPPAPAPPPGPPRRWFFIRGPVDFSDNSGSFLPFYAMDTTSGYTPPTPPPGDYALRLFDGLGNQLDEILFAPVADAGETFNDEPNPPTGSFIIPVLTNLYSAVIERVELWHGGTNLLDLRTASSTPPTFTTPLVITQTSNAIQLAWSAINASNHVIQYSPDNGTTWQTLAMDWPDQTFETDPQYLVATTNGFFRVITSDGFDNSDIITTVPITISNHAPGITLNAPMSGACFIAEEQIYLDASVSDLEDGRLEGASIQWTSSLDGPLGSGAVLNFEATTLTEGTHIITVTATDSLGLVSSMSVQICVLRAAPPALGIQRAGDEILLTWPSSVTNYVLESTFSLTPGSWTIVTNAPAAADAEQTVTVDISATNTFYRLRWP